MRDVYVGHVTPKLIPNFPRTPVIIIIIFFFPHTLAVFYRGCKNTMNDVTFLYIATS